MLRDEWDRSLSIDRKRKHLLKTASAYHMELQGPRFRPPKSNIPGLLLEEGSATHPLREGFRARSTSPQGVADRAPPPGNPIYRNEWRRKFHGYDMDEMAPGIRTSNVLLDENEHVTNMSETDPRISIKSGDGTALLRDLGGAAGEKAFQFLRSKMGVAEYLLEDAPKSQLTSQIAVPLDQVGPCSRMRRNHNSHHR